MTEQIGSLTIDRSYRGKRAPLYCRYSGQTQAQDACLGMSDDGRVWVQHDPEIGGAVPMAVWHRRTLRWTIPNSLSPQGIDDLIAAALPLLERVYAGHSVAWDGSNMVGSLNPDAEDAYMAMEGVIGDEWDTVAIWDTGDYLYPAIAWDRGHHKYIIGSDLVITTRTGERRLRQIAGRLEREATADNVYLDGDVYDELVSWQREL